MDREYTDRIIVLNAVAANGASAAVNMASFRNVEIEIDQVGFTGTVKVAASNADTAPDFSASATAANPWDFVKCVNQIDGSAVAGGTGVSGTATTSTTQLEANTNGFKWFALIVSGYSAGSVTARMKSYTGT